MHKNKKAEAHFLLRVHVRDETVREKGDLSLQTILPFSSCALNFETCVPGVERTGEDSEKLKASSEQVCHQALT